MTYSRELAKRRLTVLALVLVVFLLVSMCALLWVKVFTIPHKAMLTIEKQYAIICSEQLTINSKVNLALDRQSQILDKLSEIQIQNNKLDLLDHIKSSVETQEDLYQTIDELLDIMKGD